MDPYKKAVQKSLNAKKRHFCLTEGKTLGVMKAPINNRKPKLPSPSPCLVCSVYKKDFIDEGDCLCGAHEVKHAKHRTNKQG